MRLPNIKRIDKLLVFVAIVVVMFAGAWAAIIYAMIFY